MGLWTYTSPPFPVSSNASSPGLLTPPHSPEHENHSCCSKPSPFPAFSMAAAAESSSSSPPLSHSSPSPPAVSAPSTAPPQPNPYLNMLLPQVHYPAALLAAGIHPMHADMKFLTVRLEDIESPEPHFVAELQVAVTV